MSQADIGLIGLAVMGENLVLNMESHGFTVACSTAPPRRSTTSSNGRAQGQEDRRHALARGAGRALKRPRKIMMMVKAGTAGRRGHRRSCCRCSSRATSSSTAATPTSRTRSAATALVEAKGLLFVGTGVSGGEEGALKGPSIMPGGNARRLAARQADLPGDRRQGRRRHALLRLGRARTAPATSSRWSTTASSTATCSSSARPTSC